MIAPLGRVLLYVKDPAEIAAFYNRHFGFEIIETEGDRIIELRPKEAGATLLLHRSSKAQKPGQSLVKLVFDVEDVPGVAERCKQAGLVFGLIHQVEGYAFANAKDPAGNSIQISSRAFRE